MNLEDLKDKIFHSVEFSKEQKQFLLSKIQQEYGLNWEHVKENNIDLEGVVPLLKRKEAMTVLGAGTQCVEHVIVEGENYIALLALLHLFQNTIDIIYIDPPYNTGNKDFSYNDSFVDKEDSYRHSKWCSFIYARLKIAKDLLKDDGVLYCSIGKEELKSLMGIGDKLFGEDNRLGILIRKQKSGNNKGNFFKPTVDYILVYAKDKSKLSPFKKSVDSAKFKLKETMGPRRGELYEASKSLYQSSLDPRPNQRYYIQCPDGSLVLPPGEVHPERKEDGAQVTPETMKEKYPHTRGVCWRWGLSTYQAQKNERLVFRQSKKSPLVDEHNNPSKWNVYTKRYLSDAQKKGNVPSDLLLDYPNTKGSKRLKALDIQFTYPKPIELLQELIRLTNKPKDITVLDFFAGSGSTLDAIMTLNKIDGGTRRGILVSNNENDIAEKVTFVRNKRVITGYKKVQAHPNNNLRYYQCYTQPYQDNIHTQHQITQKMVDLICIKEGCYYPTPSLDSKIEIFSNAATQRYLIILHHTKHYKQAVQNILKFIQAHRKCVFALYITASERETVVQSLHSVADKITLHLLPEACLTNYNSIKQSL